MRLSGLGLILIPCAIAVGQVVNYEWPESIPESDLYTIKVYQNGRVYEVHPHISRPYDESIWFTGSDPEPGDNNGLIGWIRDRSMTFGTFSFEGEVWVEVEKTYGQAASRVEIAPKVFGINPTYFDGYRVRFKITHELSDIAKYIAVDFISDDNLDSDSNGGVHIKNSVMIFADKHETNAPEPTDPGVSVFNNGTFDASADVIYIPKGDYNFFELFKLAPGEYGQMPYFKDNQMVYLEPGTFIRGAFHGKGFDGISLVGRGIITGQNYPFHWFRDNITSENPTGDKTAFVKFLGCDNLTVDGIIIENPSHHTIPSAKNSMIRNLKIIGWSFNQDGIRPAEGGVVEEIFIKSQDDYDYARGPHVVKNSVFWPTHNGAVGQLGWNDLGTGYAQYVNNAYINCETMRLNNNTGVIGSQAKDGMKLTDNYLEDLYLEDFNAYLVSATFTAKPENGLAAGYLNDFTFKNITTEYPFQFTNGEKALQRMTGIEDNWLSGWTFTNLIVDGVLVTFENHASYFNMELVGTNGVNEDAANYVRNVTFDTEGELFEITANVSSGGAIHPSGLDGKITVIGGRDQSFSVIPEEGFRIERIGVDGIQTYEFGSEANSERPQLIFFNELSSDHRIEVVFEEGADYFGMENGVSDLNGYFESSVRLSWFDNSPMETSIEVWRKGTGDFEKIATLAPNEITFNDADISLGASYTYYVAAFQESQSLGQTNQFTIEPVLGTAFSARTNLYPNPVEKGSVLTLEINHSEGFDRYVVSDLRGTLVSSGKIDVDKLTFLTPSNEGIYLFHLLRSDGSALTKKLIVK